MQTLKSCGVFIVKGRPIRQFLLMRHSHRWDLPKGHVDPGESDLECAIRELEEETGIPSDAVRLDPDFVFENQYMVTTDRVPGGQALKTLRIFLGELIRDVPISTTEHPDFAWFDWNPPHIIQAQTIDSLLAAVAAFEQAH